MRDKQAFAERTGIALHIVIQFGFSPGAVCTWDRHLTAEGISVPVHVGTAGPTALARLMKFALQCGIGSSMHSLIKHKSAVAHLAHGAGPDEVLLGLVRCRREYAGSRLTQPHFYSFVGALATADWLRTVMDGRFDLQPDGARFNVV